MSHEKVSVVLTQRQDYRFELQFDATMPTVISDAPPPLGTGAGPTAEHFLCAAVGNCLSASLLFALRKFKQTPEPITAVVTADVGRNAEGRVRVLGLHAALRLGVPAASVQHLERVLEQFESYCTVSQSVGQGIPITLTVHDAEDRLLK